MKFLHLADLHLGKSIYGVSLIDNGDQIFWARRFLEKAAALKPDAVVIAGDVYDRSAPSGDAVMLLNYILTELEQMDIPVMLIAGNHDSGQRLSFAGSILAKRRIYIAGSVDAEITHVTVSDKDGSGEVTFWLVPYLFPAAAAQKLGDDSIGDYETAMRKLLERQGIDFSKRNVLVAHQNVTAGGREAGRGGSESMAGGVGQMDYRVFDGFDYVALGHIHASCSVGRREVRFAGSPLCYHFDETNRGGYYAGHDPAAASDAGDQRMRGRDSGGGGKRNGGNGIFENRCDGCADYAGAVADAAGAFRKPQKPDYGTGFHIPGVWHGVWTAGGMQ